jgi:hypothetical protein
VSSPQVHQNLFFLKKIALGENGKTKIENMLNARMLCKARRIFIACKSSMKSIRTRNCMMTRNQALKERTPAKAYSKTAFKNANK